MAGRKFGTDGEEWKTWAMNATLPAFVADKFKKSNIVVFSSGNIYPIVPLSSGGCVETDRPGPVGEYTMSCLAPVSYTHLDVYKRQLLCFNCSD